MIDPALIGVISAATALVASITGPLIALHIGRAQIRATVLSTNRQKWIDSFRELIATFSSHVATAVQMRDKIVREGKISLSAEPEILHQFERLVFTITKIRLMVNPLEDDHQKLLSVMQNLLATLRTAPLSDDVQGETETTVRQIVDMSLAILRREWQRVKRGA